MPLALRLKRTGARNSPIGYHYSCSGLSCKRHADARLGVAADFRRSASLEHEKSANINVAWATVILGFALWVNATDGKFSNPALLGIAAFYLLIALLLFRRYRLATAFSVLVATVITLWQVPWIIMNIWMYFEDHPIYIYSPATIIIIIMNALVLVMAGSFLFGLYVINRKELLESFKHPINR